MTDKALCEYLKKYRHGQESAASSKELEAAFHVKGTELRRATVAQLTGRISKIAAATKGLLKSYEEKEG